MIKLLKKVQISKQSGRLKNDSKIYKAGYGKALESQ